MAIQIVRDFSIMGSTFLKLGNAVDLIRKLRPNTPLRFVREPKNAPIRTRSSSCGMFPRRVPYARPRSVTCRAVSPQKWRR